MKIMKYKRVMALDYGQKRIGVAVSDLLGLTAQPRDFIYNNDKLLDCLCQLIKDEDIDHIILGLPLNSVGELGDKALEVKAFGGMLQETISCTLEYMDERFSTVAATRQLDTLGLSRKQQRKKVDSQAAAFILQGFLDRNL